jgi:hypothetical protein
MRAGLLVVERRNNSYNYVNPLWDKITLQENILWLAFPTPLKMIYAN